MPIHNFFRVRITRAMLILLGLLLLSCHWHGIFHTSSQNILVQLLKAHPQYFGFALKNPERYRLQILYTQIDRDSTGRPHFTLYSYRVNPHRYFYPASAIKLVAVLLALEKLNLMHIPGLDKYTPFRIDSAYSGQTAFAIDSTAPGGKPTIAHMVKKIFLVSDNNAFNRLYEFLGQQYIRKQLDKHCFPNVWVIRRLETDTTPEENRATNPITFYRDDKLILAQPLEVNPEHYMVDLPDVFQGKGYIENGKLIRKPKDFRFSNFISIPDLQAMLAAVFFPKSLPPACRFALSRDDLNFIRRYMGLFPRESDIPAYRDSTRYPDNYVKIFLIGDGKYRLPPGVRIFNKSGRAYGYLIDNAYIVDFRNHVEFLLTAVIQVNRNQIYNDGQYEYEEEGLPFLANLGRVIYQYELQRKRKFLPDLSALERLFAESKVQKNDVSQ